MSGDATHTVMTPATVLPVPGKGTTRRSVRIDDEAWNAAKKAADERGETLSDVIRAALVEYVDTEPQ